MSNFKQALISTLAFLLVLCLLCTGMLLFGKHHSMFVYHDSDDRDQLAGQLDLLVCGGSYGEVAVNPEDLDAALGTFSYNLGSPRLLLHGRTWLLRKELDRNPVKTVILEVSLDVLGQDETSPAYARGEARTLARLGSFQEQAAYFRQYVPAENREECLALYLRYSVLSLQRWVLQGDAGITPAIRGFRTNSLADQTLTPEEIRRSHDAIPMDEPRPENLAELQAMVDLCRDHDVQIIVIVTPTSDANHWETVGEQGCYDTLQAFCSRNGLPLVNFDLDRSRYELYHDEDSFSDRWHLCKEGAARFSPRCAGILADLLAGRDISDLFFDDYAEMEALSPYAAGSAH